VKLVELGMRKTLTTTPPYGGLIFNIIGIGA